MDKYHNLEEEEDFPIEISSKYEIIQEIGRGAFSIVYKVKSKENNNIYCLKKINTKKTKDKENEIKILSNLNHPNLIKCFYSFYNSDNIYIIIDFCEFGDLFSLLQSVKKKKVFVNEDIIWNIAIQTLIGLNYLHTKKIIHRDIKLLNLFMTKDKKIKIGDMGMSTILEGDELINTRVGTPLYIAPELVKKEKYDYKIDIWSLGCSLYHLAKTSPPFNDENLIKLGNAIISEQPKNLPICYSYELYDFILRLMTKDKDCRPSAKEALELIPEKIKNKFYKLYNFYSIKKKKNKVENDKLIEKQKLVNKVSKNLSKLEEENNHGIAQFDKYISKSMKNEKYKNNKIDKALVSGQTFYQFFKMNNTKYKDHYKNVNMIHKNETTNASNSTNNNNLLLSKTMFQINENFLKVKKPSTVKINFNNNIKALKSIINNKENKDKEKDKEDINKNNNFNNIDINNNKKINNNIEPILNKEERKIINNNINIKISERYKKDFDSLIKDENKNHKNISFSMDKYIKLIHNPAKTFLLKDGINKNSTILTNKMKLINKKYKIDNDKEETIFPKIQNKYKFKSNSLIKYKNYPEVQNFGFTGYNKNFKNKLTIHDLK